jgi:hypothetical protein
LRALRRTKFWRVIPRMAVAPKRVATILGSNRPSHLARAYEELDMVRNFTTALVTALVLGSVGIASARVFAPSIEHWTSQSDEPYCYLPSWPCEQLAPHNKPIP